MKIHLQDTQVHWKSSKIKTTKESVVTRKLLSQFSFVLETESHYIAEVELCSLGLPLTHYLPASASPTNL